MIHFLTPEYPPNLGGVADYTHQIATELARAGETVHVWGPSGIAPVPGSPVAVHAELGRFRPVDLRRAGALLDACPAPRRLVLQWVPHGFGLRAMNLPFCLWLWRRAVAGDVIELIVHEPFVTFSGGAGQYAMALVQRAMTLLLMSAARRVWVTTRAWVPLLEPYLAGGSAPVEWLPVPSSLQSADGPTIGAARARHTQGAEFLIGHFGTHGSLVTTLLADAIPLIAEARPSARFLLIGAESETFRAALVSRDAALAGRVTATGTLPSGELSAHIAACDVLLQPYPDGVTSRRTTVMAGLRAGVPIVTTDGRLTEAFWRESAAVKMGKAGIAQSIAAHVLEVLADPAARQRQAEEGRAFYDRWFDVRHTVAALAA
jgi:glycosyltransferase involved in cell wall biosynthesis